MSSSSAFWTVTAPCTRSSIVVAPSRGARSRTTNGAPASASDGSRSRHGLRIRSGRFASAAAARCAAISSAVIPAAIGVAGRHHLVRDGGVALGTRELEQRVVVPVQPQPAHAVEDRLDRRLRRARAIGILDAEQEAPAVVARVQPVEQRRTCPADVQESGRRRRETGDDGAVGRRAGIVGCAQARVLPSWIKDGLFSRARP